MIWKSTPQSRERILACRECTDGMSFSLLAALAHAGKADSGQSGFETGCPSPVLTWNLTMTGKTYVQEGPQPWLSIRITRAGFKSPDSQARTCHRPAESEPLRLGPRLQEFFKLSWHCDIQWRLSTIVLLFPEKDFTHVVLYKGKEGT